MQMLRVNEVFYSLQGEGARKGSPNIFIRLAECNLTCSFCDTEFESYNEVSINELLRQCRQFPSKNLVFTGGEPLLQLTSSTLEEFKNAGYYLAVETNGTVSPPKGIDWITLSPKVAEHVVVRNFKDAHIDELKYVRNKSQGIPRPKLRADHYFLAPEFDGDYPNDSNIRHCIELVKKYPDWKLSLQEHKMLRIK